MSTCVRYERDAHGIAMLILDLPGKSVNTLSRQMWADLAAAVEQCHRDRPRGVIVASGKPRTFIAGADLFELRAMTDPELHEYLLTGQRILQQLEQLPMPTVAAINGDALGGGLEVALACRMRVCADEPGVKLGLPEVTLGLVPGWGGTVRLARLLGVRQAVAIASGGKPVPPAEALKLGLVDAVVPREQLLSQARELLGKEMPARAAVAATKADLDWLAGVEEELSRKNGSLNPAPARVVRVIRTSAESGTEAGFTAERNGLVELRSTPAGRNLLRLFFLRQNARKEAANLVGGTPRTISRVGVIGGGVMGGGIVQVLVKSGLTVTCVEAEAVASSVQQRLCAALAKEGLTTERLTVSSRLADIAPCDLVIEAILEDFEAKRSLFQQLDSVAAPQTILASNTSSLSITRLAAETSDPSRVVGIHFFNPVPKMPLVEIVRQPCSSADSLATAVGLAGALGKIPIVCNDAPGFIVNRILMPYLSESMRLAGEGVAIDAIDSAVRQWGMPMGPFELLDQIGLDVILGIFRALQPHLGDRIAIPAALEAAVATGWLGRKARVGFYRYPDDRGRSPEIHLELVGRFGRASQSLDATAIQDRCLLPMANEAARVLQEQVTESTDAIDLACITGLGMAGWRGGICQFVRDTGVSVIVSKLQQLAAAHGDRLSPCEYLWKLK
ncbi:MAG: 3-hydroxyacyl-CoA dehydrogenase NAD-binding domain-containing protein, partial [Phycisphaerae bacterium]|nr:3-hydroxyacyl-CoA dehydrogenase NAD-binding domain-containing protein [Phycisphaerae bacterium]MDW8261892.1 3-hydroxyacyl-CoA dehydrogenase NAD-binding domain-containing protein [Phycisphaerales bacterium]